jgi:uncharacterized protein YbjT (DUF2867 family)
MILVTGATGNVGAELVPRQRTFALRLVSLLPGSAGPTLA